MIVAYYNKPYPAYSKFKIKTIQWDEDKFFVDFVCVSRARKKKDLPSSWVIKERNCFIWYRVALFQKRLNEYKQQMSCHINKSDIWCETILFFLYILIETPYNESFTQKQKNGVISSVIFMKR